MATSRPRRPPPPPALGGDDGGGSAASPLLEMSDSGGPGEEATRSCVVEPTWVLGARRQARWHCGVVAVVAGPATKPSAVKAQSPTTDAMVRESEGIATLKTKT
jgi:hypothetical protein